MKYTIGSRIIDLSRVTWAHEEELPKDFAIYDDIYQQSWHARRSYTFIIGSRDFEFCGSSGQKLYQIFQDGSTKL